MRLPDRYLVPGRRLATLAVFSLAAFAIPLVSVAATQDAPSVQVRYDDLDLSRADGVKALYRRIRNAAENVCGAAETRSPALTRQWRDCFHTAVDDAVRTVDRPMLSSLHAEMISRG